MNKFGLPIEWKSLPFDEITASELNGVDFDLDDNGFDPESL